MMRCEYCKFWDPSCQRASAEPDTTGLCRFNPPRDDERNGAACWPFTEDSDWCGKFERAEDADVHQGRATND